MKAEDIDNMQAGRELDWDIAEQIFGFNIFREKTDNKLYVGHSRLRHEWQELPGYSTDIAAAWLVVEKLRQMQRTVTLGTLGVLPEPLSWGCNIFRGLRQLETVTQAVADTAPLAICRAALKAVASQQPEGEGK